MELSVFILMKFYFARKKYINFGDVLMCSYQQNRPKLCSLLEKLCIKIWMLALSWLKVTLTVMSCVLS